jgi:hypothetical protein
MNRIESLGNHFTQEPPAAAPAPAVPNNMEQEFKTASPLSSVIQSLSHQPQSGIATVEPSERRFEKEQEPLTPATPAPGLCAPSTCSKKTYARPTKPPSFNSLSQHQSSNVPVESSARMDIASDLRRNMILYLGFEFAGRRCLDIGTRSGENALFMQRNGGEVVGIDPDDSEFKTAIQIGIPRENLHKTTLQDYQKKYPDEKFDLATVFLWNIPASEKEEFCQALTQIINKNGAVVIGYKDEFYHTPPDDLLSLLGKYFTLVKLYEFPNSLNRYMLVCQIPKIATIHE